MLLQRTFHDLVEKHPIECGGILEDIPSCHCGGNAAGGGLEARFTQHHVGSPEAAPEEDQEQEDDNGEHANENDQNDWHGITRFHRAFRGGV